MPSKNRGEEKCFTENTLPKDAADDLRL